MNVKVLKDCYRDYNNIMKSNLRNNWSLNQLDIYITKCIFNKNILAGIVVGVAIKFISWYYWFFKYKRLTDGGG